MDNSLFILFERPFHMDNYMVYGFVVPAAEDGEYSYDTYQKVLHHIITLSGVHKIQTTGGEILLPEEGGICREGSGHIIKTEIEYLDFCYKALQDRSPIICKEYNVVSANSAPESLIHRSFLIDMIVNEEFWESLYDGAMSNVTAKQVSEKRLKEYYEWWKNVYLEPGIPAPFKPGFGLKSVC